MNYKQPYVLRNHYILQKGFMTAFFIFLLTIANICEIAANGTEEILLQQEDLYNSEKLIKKHKTASPQESSLAASILKKADNAASESRWGAALKQYGESSLIAPSAESLYGYAQSLAQIERLRKDKKESFEAKKRDFEQSKLIFTVVIEFAHHIYNSRNSEILQNSSEAISCITMFLSETDSTSSVCCTPVKEGLENSRLQSPEKCRKK